MKWSKIQISKISRALSALLLVGLLLRPLLLHAQKIQSSFESSGLVSEFEAVAIADLWYCMELNSGYAKLNETERTERISSLFSRTVHYLVSKDELRDTPPAEGNVLAYIVKYNPSGFVIVAGSDRIQPIIAFDVESVFYWGHPGTTALRDCLGKGIVQYWQKSIEGIHPHWRQLRLKLQTGIKLNEVAFETSYNPLYILWDTALWGQDWPYNEVVAENNKKDGNPNLNIPTGCVATAMAIKMRFHEWPIMGEGSHTYEDIWDSVQFRHSVNFDSYTYKWANMPPEMHWPSSPSLIEISTLMYHCGVSVDMNYEEHGSSTYGIYVPKAMHTHFSYKGTEEILSDDPCKYETAIISSLRGGLPVLITVPTHFMMVDGYRDTEAEFWHINGGNSPHSGHPETGNRDAYWTSLTVFGVYESYVFCSPKNYIYVNANWSGTENGNLQTPFNTFAEGESAVPFSGHLWLKAGSYSVPATLTKPMTLRSYEGTAILRK